jgi:hypothetical protein
MSNSLNLETNLIDHDSTYQLIIDMHKDLSDEESQLANAKLILALTNHIGEHDVIAQATHLAKQNTLDWRKT